MTVDTVRPAASAAPGTAPAGPAGADRPGSVLRRLVALLVDLVVIAVPTLAVAASQAQAVVRDPADPVAPDPSWLTVGGTAYRWTTGGVWLTGVAALLSALIVLALLPANVSGWTPGLRLVRLRVITTAGTRAQLHHHLVRTVVGLVDLAPWVVPGLVGWFLAHRSPLHQRLGDRLARTMVVDHRHPERPVDPGSGRRPRSGPLAEPTAPTRSPRRAAADRARQWKVEQVNAPAGPVLPPILPATVEVTVPAPSHRRPADDTRAVRPDPITARAAQLRVTVPRRGPLPGSGPEPELVPEWSDRWQAWVVLDGETGQLFRHDAATGAWLPL